MCLYGGGFDCKIGKREGFFGHGGSRGGAVGEREGWERNETERNRISVGS